MMSYDITTHSFPHPYSFLHHPTFFLSLSTLSPAFSPPPLLSPSPPTFPLSLYFPPLPLLSLLSPLFPLTAHSFPPPPPLFSPTFPLLSPLYPHFPLSPNSFLPILSPHTRSVTLHSLNALEFGKTFNPSTNYKYQRSIYS